MSELQLLQENIQSKYLNSDGADVWFVFGDERIPGHKYILALMSPWFNTMFNGMLPQGDNVDMNNASVTAEAFKEFLRFIYLQKPNLTMENIAEIMNLAKQSLVEKYFTECEIFLIKSLTINDMFFGYHLALLYEASKLKAHCEQEIGLKAEKLLKSSTFLEFHYDYLKNLLECNALVCEEKQIFDACIAWAKAECERNNKNSSDPINLRAQLKQSIYQIRFNSMTKEEAADCIFSCPGFFNAEELEEIVCMVGRKQEFQTKKFNWNLRNPKVRHTNKRELICSRFQTYNYIVPWIRHDFQMEEITKFKCNKLLLLNGFTCEGADSRLLVQNDRSPVFLSGAPVSRHVHVRITETNLNNDIDELYSQRILLEFTSERNLVQYDSHEALVKLDQAILLRPKNTYTIEIQFSSEPRIHNNCSLKRYARVDHNIEIEFNDKRGAISSLHLSRIEEENSSNKLPWYYKVLFAYLVICFLSWLVGAGRDYASRRY